MNCRVLNNVSGRLSLRSPQRESLEALAIALESALDMLLPQRDVTNLYTIVPLRAANAKTLIEQSIGRGLRLPYDKRTGVATVDRLNIVAHDRFQEIADEANNPENWLRLKQVFLDAPENEETTESIEIGSNVESLIAGTVNTGSKGTVYPLSDSTKPIFNGVAEIEVAKVALHVIN